MDNGAYIFRMIGFLGIGVGAAWALQILGFAPNISAGDKLLWIVGAASVAGGSFGLILVSNAFDNQPVTAKA